MSSPLNLQRVITSFQRRVRNSIVATVHDYQQFTPRLARVVVCFNTDDADPADLGAAVTAALGGKAVPVEDSFRFVHSHALPTAVGFIRSNTEVLDFDEAQKRSMRTIAANVLMDASDESIWEVRHATAGAKVLVRQGTEDLASVLETAAVRVQRTPMLASLGVEFPEPRKFVAFVDPRFNAVRYGYVIESDADATSVSILPFPSAEEMADDQALMPADNSSEEMRGDGNVISQRLADRCAPISVGLDNLVETAHMNGNDSFAAIAAPGDSERSKMLDYYKKVYDYAPDYYEKVKETIQGHAGL